MQKSLTKLALLTVYLTEKTQNSIEKLESMRQLLRFIRDKSKVQVLQITKIYCSRVRALSLLSPNKVETIFSFI